MEMGIKDLAFFSPPGRLAAASCITTGAFLVSRASSPVHAVYVCGYMHGPIRDHSSCGVIVAPL